MSDPAESAVADVKIDADATANQEHTVSLCRACAVANKSILQVVPPASTNGGTPTNAGGGTPVCCLGARLSNLPAEKYVISFLRNRKLSPTPARGCRQRDILGYWLFGIAIGPLNLCSAVFGPLLLDLAYPSMDHG